MTEGKRFIDEQRIGLRPVASRTRVPRCRTRADPDRGPCHLRHAVRMGRGHRPTHPRSDPSSWNPNSAKPSLPGSGPCGRSSRDEPATDQEIAVSGTPSRRGLVSTGDRTRTCTVAHLILSQARLPISPPRRCGKMVRREGTKDNPERAGTRWHGDFPGGPTSRPRRLKDLLFPGPPFRDLHLPCGQRLFTG